MDSGVRSLYGMGGVYVCYVSNPPTSPPWVKPQSTGVSPNYLNVLIDKVDTMWYPEYIGFFSVFVTKICTSTYVKLNLRFIGYSQCDLNITPRRGKIASWWDKILYTRDCIAWKLWCQPRIPEIPTSPPPPPTHPPQGVLVLLLWVGGWRASSQTFWRWIPIRKRTLTVLFFYQGTFPNFAILGCIVPEDTSLYLLTNFWALLNTILLYHCFKTPDV